MDSADIRLRSCLGVGTCHSISVPLPRSRHSPPPVTQAESPRCHEAPRGVSAAFTDALALNGPFAAETIEVVGEATHRLADCFQDQRRFDPHAFRSFAGRHGTSLGWRTRHEPARVRHSCVEGATPGVASGAPRHSGRRVETARVGRQRCNPVTRMGMGSRTMAVIPSLSDAILLNCCDHAAEKCCGRSTDPEPS